MNYDRITHENWQELTFQDAVNLSASPEIRSQHPFIEAYGDRVMRLAGRRLRVRFLEERETLPMTTSENGKIVKTSVRARN